MNEFIRRADNPFVLLDEYACIRHSYLVNKIGEQAVVQALDEHQLSIDVMLSLSDDEFDAYLGQDVYPVETNNYDDASMEFFMKTKELFGSIDGYSLMSVDTDHMTLFTHLTPPTGSFLQVINLSHDGATGYQKDRLILGGKNAGRTPLEVTSTDKEAVRHAWEKLADINTILSKS